AYMPGWDFLGGEAIGVLKVDFLGLRNLTVIGDALANIKKNRGIDLNLEDLQADDPQVSKVYDLLSSGDTLGVFQLDSGGMQELLKRLKPTGFNDVVPSLPLYRPGP